MTYFLITIAFIQFTADDGQRRRCCRRQTTFVESLLSWTICVPFYVLVNLMRTAHNKRDSIKKIKIEFHLAQRAHCAGEEEMFITLCDIT